MKERVIGLKFIPDERFKEMYEGLQNLISLRYDGVFFLNASEKAIEKIKYHACLGSNKLNGWVIPKNKVEEFDLLFSQDMILTGWDSYKTSVWAWYDTEGCHKWLYSFTGSIFGETVIE